ncbi:fumarylacetoacetate hydrolase family protein [Thalassolituus alkanivorans]|uniref:fumarylacetoacetate hydrolase family protein n=1 Tax=Thalassolituus alkanivorans TaxID=2881055 RepID=UPI001E5A7EEF|nr:fumarylacetoacetate hydrolase family protein [Thalassolituus alkanivorans]MCB2388438.1 fumarylacetoacetate hydrolase family protein [Thalassolituus alkanivorans]MCB2423844.1 fumarylacetoacetate hydrolase family protein [Thalassolituus alkanivorans]
MYFPILEGQSFTHSTGKIVCVGRNYAEHARELNNPIPSQPILFIKPADAAVSMAPSFRIPQGQGSVHHELEIAVLIGQRLCHAAEDDVPAAIAGVGLGLDLTLRDVQDGLKAKGQPWEIAKGFDGACPLSDFVAASRVEDWQQLSLTLTRNGKVQQQGSSADMLFPLLPLIAHMSRIFTLNPGDIIMTGTPAGVGPLLPGDQLEARLQDWLRVHCSVEEMG